MLASMPAAMLLSTGLADEACTRTSTSPGRGFGVGRSSRAAGEAPASLSVMAFIFCVPSGFEGSVGCGSECLLDGVADLPLRAVGRSYVNGSTVECDEQYTALNDLVGYIVLMTSE